MNSLGFDQPKSSHASQVSVSWSIFWFVCTLALSISFPIAYTQKPDACAGRVWVHTNDTGVRHCNTVVSGGLMASNDCSTYVPMSVIDCSVRTMRTIHVRKKAIGE